MKTLYLIFYGRFPSEKAAALFAAKDSEAFAEEGVNVVLLVPRRSFRDRSDPFEYYHIKKNFKIVYLPTFDLLFLPFFRKFFFVLGYFFFSISSAVYLLFKMDKKDVVYSNESLPLLFSSFFFKNTFYEMHDFPESKFGAFGYFLKRMRFALVHNKWKIARLHELYRMGQEKILYEPNAVDLHDFDILDTKEEARKKLGLSLHKKIVVYTGHLYGWKGVDTLAEAALLLPKEYLVIFVGGTDADVLRFRGKYDSDERIMIVGNRKHDEIPLWQKAADTLVLPNTAKEKISKYYTSPMKLFEYMASKRPVVVTDIPSIREIADEKNALIVPADDPKEMAAGLLRAIQDEQRAKEASGNAYRYVLEHTWKERAKRILRFMRERGA